MKTSFYSFCSIALLFTWTAPLLQGERLLVEYGFTEVENATTPITVDPAIEASQFMMDSFFPPHRDYFDGSRGGEAGEATVDSRRPAYYHFTVSGLSSIQSLERLEIKITTRRRHAASRHRIDLEAYANEREWIGPMAFDFYKGDEISGNPEAEGLLEATVGQSGSYLGHVGDSGFLVVDLTDMEVADVMSFRINFDDERGRSRTAIREVRLYGR
ncbi:MAG: hypothetical protein JJT75_09840 [Opitutales bacterium]|nr:hypothetical protein [Opitutales bacterium]MCH8474032.1 hypothetical protein [Opitutales bacterium]